jgi:hypothetical protein
MRLARGESRNLRDSAQKLAWNLDDPLDPRLVERGVTWRSVVGHDDADGGARYVR